MGLWAALFGRTDRKYSTRELKELGVLDDGADGRSNRKKSGAAEFVEQMRTVKQLEAEMRETERARESEFLEKFSKLTEKADDDDEGGSGGVADALFLQLVGKALNKQASPEQSQAPLAAFGFSPASGRPLEGQFQANAEPPTLDPSQAETYAEQIANMIPNRYKERVAEEMNGLSDSDLLAIGKNLRTIFSKGGR